MTNADHPPERGHPAAGSGLAAALEEMSRRGAAMAPPQEEAYAKVRGRVRSRRAAKVTGAGMMSVAAVTLVAAGALYDPPHDMGYAPGVAGFPSGPEVLGLGADGEADLILGFQPPGWEGTAIACGDRLPGELLPDGPDVAGPDPSDAADTRTYGLEITDVRRNTLAVTRIPRSLSSDVLAGPVSYVWTQDDLVVSLPVDAVQEATLGVESFTRYDTPSTRSACLGHDGSGEDTSAPTAEPPELPAGTYQVRAYQSLVPAGGDADSGAVARAVEDPSSWSAAVTVRLTEDGVVLPAD
ncbi:hypothetical protein [Myceligenerans indicum]|uniref:DUF4179 domain-containing protein n=1 Tax=Myceligenerans indicum TaxID=2593663 RepID=A0ABS1LLR6_9MICO|nr:hypothetical protein [Myceligenerans indicum]MBL0887181.1 hypothetical protein [Myceligenerans indicum]